MSQSSTGHKKGTGNRIWLGVLIILCLVLAGFAALASVAYWRLQRESRTRIVHLEREVESRQEQMNRMLKDQTGLEASLEEMQLALEQLRKRQQAAESRLEKFKSLLQSLQSMRDAGNLTVKVVDGRAVLALPIDILFPSGSSNLSPRGKKAIQDLAKVLKEIEDQRFQIEGHTDTDPIALRGYTNWELASERSLVVLHTMIASGMEANRISAASYGATRPVVENRSPANKALNRRIEIVLVPDLSDLPGATQMQEMLDALE